jgi:hypothetical protein
LDSAALDDHIRAVTAAVERAAGLLHALAPLRAQLARLDAAIAAVGEAAALSPDDPHAGSRTGISRPPEDLEVQPAPAAPAERLTDPPDAEPMPNPPAATSSGIDDTNGSASPDGARAGRCITVTVTREDVPLDLVRVHSALDQVQGVTSLALLSYARGRAILQIETERPIDELPLAEGLRAAFPEGVTARRQGADALEMTIGAQQ